MSIRIPTNRPASAIPGKEYLEPISKVAADRGLTVDAYKVQILSEVRKPADEAIMTGIGQGYYYHQARNGMDWRILFSDRTRVVVPRIVILDPAGYYD